MWKYVETKQGYDYYCGVNESNTPIFNCCLKGEKFNQSATGGYYFLDSLQKLKHQRHFTANLN